MEKVNLGLSGILISKYCLGTMTFGEQVSQSDAHRILDRAYERGINFIDTAEMYSVPPKAKKFGLSELIIGDWFKKNPSKRSSMVCATKISGPSRGMPWIRSGVNNISTSDIEDACNSSLVRLQTDVIDLYQIHWPYRNVPSFGSIYFDPAKDDLSLITIYDQLNALHKLVKAGKVRSIGLSNESPYGLHEFLRVAKEFNFPEVVSVQNPYCLINRSVENALDESLFRLKVSLLAYSPLAFGLLTGKYDLGGFEGEFTPKNGRIRKYESIRRQRWGRENSLEAARKYNKLALENNMTPIQLALGFCNTKWQVTSTIIGVTSMQQLNQNIDAADITLNSSILDSINFIRSKYYDPAA